MAEQRSVTAALLRLLPPGHPAGHGQWRGLHGQLEVGLDLPQGGRLLGQREGDQLDSRRLRLRLEVNGRKWVGREEERGDVRDVGQIFPHTQLGVARLGGWQSPGLDDPVGRRDGAGRSHCHGEDSGGRQGRGRGGGRGDGGGRGGEASQRQQSRGCGGGAGGDRAVLLVLHTAPAVVPGDGFLPVLRGPGSLGPVSLGVSDHHQGQRLPLLGEGRGHRGEARHGGGAPGGHGGHVLGVWRE